MRRAADTMPALMSVAARPAVAAVASGGQGGAALGWALSIFGHVALLGGALLAWSPPRPDPPRVVAVELVSVAALSRAAPPAAAAIKAPPPAPPAAAQIVAAPAPAPPTPARSAPLRKTATPAPPPPVVAPPPRRKPPPPRRKPTVAAASRPAAARPVTPAPPAAPPAPPAAAMRPVPATLSEVPAESAAALDSIDRAKAAPGAGKERRSARPDGTTTGPSRPVARRTGNPAPQYPYSARLRGIEGRVVVRVRVGADGRPERAWLGVSSGYGSLDAAALAAVGKWRFAPARFAGLAVAGMVDVPVSFRLSD
jgi:periplasmic protein TonB